MSANVSRPRFSLADECFTWLSVVTPGTRIKKTHPHILQELYMFPHVHRLIWSVWCTQNNIWFTSHIPGTKDRRFCNYGSKLCVQYSHAPDRVRSLPYYILQSRCFGQSWNLFQAGYVRALQACVLLRASLTLIKMILRRRVLWSYFSAIHDHIVHTTTTP